MDNNKNDLYDFTPSNLPDDSNTYDYSPNLSEQSTTKSDENIPLNTATTSNGNSANQKLSEKFSFYLDTDAKILSDKKLTRLVQDGHEHENKRKYLEALQHYLYYLNRYLGKKDGEYVFVKSHTQNVLNKIQELHGEEAINKIKKELSKTKWTKTKNILFKETGLEKNKKLQRTKSVQENLLSIFWTKKPPNENKNLEFGRANSSNNLSSKYKKSQ